MTRVILMDETLPSIIVHLITIARGIDNVEPQAHTVFLNDYLDQYTSDSDD